MKERSVGTSIGKYTAAIELMKQAEKDININAAVGYQVDSSLPAPEALERPGWKEVWAPPGVAELKMAVGPDPVELFRIALAHETSDPDPSCEHAEVVVIRPRWTVTVRVGKDGPVRLYGLGLNVDERVVVFFDLGQQRQEPDEE